MERRVDEFQRLRAHQLINLRQAQVDLLGAETAVNAAQRAFFEDAAKDALQKCVQLCREPLRDLQRFAAAAAYHAQSGHGEFHARSAWSGANAFELLESALNSDGAFGREFGMNEKIKGAPSILVVRSDEISSAEREAAAVLSRSGALSAGNLTAKLAVKEAPSGDPAAIDDRYRAGFQIEYWNSVVDGIERSIEDEHTREYAVFGAEGPINSEAVRKRNIEALQLKLKHARQCVSNWQAN